MPDPQDAVDSADTLATAVGVLALGLLGWAVGSKLVRKYVKIAAIFGALSFAFTSAQAALPDATTTVTAASTLATAIGVLALGLLGWAVGSKLVRKYVK